MEYTKSFEDLLVWQKSRQFVIAVYQLTKSFPPHETYGMTSQLQRAAVSIAANIAEGYKRIGRSDKLRFMNIAQGSLEECKNHIILAHDVGYLSDTTYQQMISLINDIGRLLTKYYKGIETKIFTEL